MNIRNIENAIRKSKKAKVLIANECGFARTTLDAILRGAEVGIGKIEKLAEVLDVPASYFFQEDDAPVPKNIEGASAQVTERIKHLEERLADKEQQLADKERLIQLLMQQK
jgi:transcriptional regulator with XRE-family HTH domain